MHDVSPDMLDETLGANHYGPNFDPCQRPKASGPTSRRTIPRFGPANPASLRKKAHFPMPPLFPTTASFLLSALIVAGAQTIYATVGFGGGMFAVALLALVLISLYGGLRRRKEKPILLEPQQQA